MSYYSNLKVYNEKGQRMAIFGSLKSDVEIEVFELTCSKKDQFNKAEAKGIYEKYLAGDRRWDNGPEEVDKNGVIKTRIYHPKIYSLVPEDAKRPKWSFLKHINNTFFKETIIEVEFNQEILDKILKVGYIYDRKKKIVQIKTLAKWQSKV